MGCRRPRSRIDAASSASLSSAKYRRGCSGLGSTDASVTTVSTVRCRRPTVAATASERREPSPLVPGTSVNMHHLHPASPAPRPATERAAFRYCRRAGRGRLSPGRHGVRQPIRPERLKAITRAKRASASISAKPTMSGVKTRSAEFGLRPIDSMAAAVARPCPRAAPKAASPRPRPAARAIRPLSIPPPAPAVSAKAGVVSRSAAITIPTTLDSFMYYPLRRPSASLPRRLYPPLPPGDGRDQNLMLVCRGERDVDRAQHREHEGLHDGDECAEHVERHRNHEFREAREDAHDLVV